LKIKRKTLIINGTVEVIPLVGLHEWRLGTDCVVTVMTAPSLLVQVNDCRHFNPVEDAHVGRVKPVRVQGLKATQWASG
jgi:hypothetical protein